MSLSDRLFRARPSGGKQASQSPAFGYAVVGLGHIAEYFLDAMRNSSSCAVTALVSGNADKARKTASKYNVPHTLTYDSFDSICDTPGVDAVYLALPVSMHLGFTRRAAAAGKHVLCEKPMAPTAEDAREMIAVCAAAEVHLSIAYRCPYTLIHQRARDLIRSGALGTSLRLESGFGFELKPGWRANPALAGGGSLYDVGIYPLNAARYLLEEEPSGVSSARATCDANGLEQAIEWTCVFPSGATAVCRSSYREHIPDTLRVIGSRGQLLLAPAFSHREQLRLRGEYKDASTGRTVLIDERTPRHAISQFQMEAESLAAVVRDGQKPITPGEDGLNDMIAIAQIYCEAGVPAITSAQE